MRIDKDVNTLFQEYARTRDNKLRNRLVIENSQLARLLAARFSGPGSDFDDFLQVARIGLIKAVERFDPEKEVSFSSFATPTILGELKRYLRDKTWAVRSPRRVRELEFATRKTRESLEQRYGRPPTVSELSKATGVSEKLLAEAEEIALTYRPVSLDAQRDTDHDEQPMLGAVAIYDEPGYGRVEDRDVLRRALKRLTPRQRAVLYRYYVLEENQTVIAAAVNVSQMQVSRDLRRGLKVLREHLG